MKGNSDGGQRVSSYSDIYVSLVYLFRLHKDALACEFTGFESNRERLVAIEILCVSLSGIQKTINELHVCLQEEWDKLTIQDFLKYILEMLQRCEAVIENAGGHTKW